MHHLVQEFGRINYTRNDEDKLGTIHVYKVVEVNLSINQLYEVVIVAVSIGVSVSNTSIFSKFCLFTLMF